jgi:hypothetical protein
MGYATLLYYTSGNSATKLSSRFLSYPPHAIAFVCFHELFHRHKSNKKSRLPYAFEEATCDWLGNTAAAAFFEKYAVSHPMFKGYADSVRFQTNINLQTFQLLTRASVPSANRKAIADSLELLKPYYNLFQQDRLLYPLNNALLLRTSYYARNLFLINDVFATIGSISKTTWH